MKFQVLVVDKVFGSVEYVAVADDRDAAEREAREVAGRYCNPDDSVVQVSGAVTRFFVVDPYGDEIDFFVEVRRR